MRSSTPRQAQHMRRVAAGMPTDSHGPSIKVARDFVRQDHRGPPTREQKQDRAAALNAWATSGNKESP